MVARRCHVYCQHQQWSGGTVLHPSSPCAPSSAAALRAPTGYVTLARCHALTCAALCSCPALSCAVLGHDNAGGVAYLNVWGSSNHYYQPAYVFPDQLGGGYPKYLWEAVSHVGSVGGDA